MKKFTKEKGQAIYEYLIATAILVTAFMVPLPMLNDMSLFDYLVLAFKSNNAAYKFASSLPT